MKNDNWSINSLGTPTKKTILIVEDDIDISSALQELLEENNYNVLSSANGAEALDMLKSILLNPSLILLDLMMPIMNGLQFRENQLSDPMLKNIPVIIMSADGRMLERKSEIIAAEDYLKKPLDIYKLLDIVAKFAA